MCGLLRLWGILCAVAAQSVQNAALTLQRKAVFGHQMGPHFVHEVAVQMVDAAALHALQVQVFPAVAAFVHILEHGLLALVGHIFHDALLPGQLVEVAVHGGWVGAGTLLLQMLQNVGGTDCVLPVVDEIIQNQLAGLGIVAVAPCHGKRTLPF